MRVLIFRKMYGWNFLVLRINVSQAYVTTGLTNVWYIRSLDFVVNNLLWKRSWFAWNALFPNEILPFISSSIELFRFTIDPRYLNDLTCSSWVWTMSIPSVLCCFFLRLRYFVLCSFMFTPTCADISVSFWKVSTRQCIVLVVISISSA